MATLEDIEALIARTALGDRDAFRALYALTSAKLFGVCLRILNDRTEAEDALQGAFVKVWRGADRYQAGGYSPMTWLITLARNHAIDVMRARRAKGTTLDEAGAVPDSGPGPEEQTMAAQDRARLIDCLDSLPANRAAAVRAAYLDGDTYADLAARFDVPLNTMRTWLRRSLLKLRECLTQ